MSQLARVILGLFFVNAVCIVLVVATHYSDTAWGCIRYETSPRSAVLDVKNNVYLVEATPSPAYDNFTVSWLASSNQLLYQTPNDGERFRLTLVNQARILGYVDNDDPFERVTRLEGISPKRKYAVFSTHDIAQRTKTVTIRDLNTLAPITSTTLSSNELSIYSYFRQAPGYVTRGWSDTERWFGVFSTTPNTAVLALIDVLHQTTQTLPLKHLDPTSIIWSPSETQVAVISGYRSLYLDIITFKDGNWQHVSSTDLTYQGATHVSQQTLDVRWTFNSTALLVTLTSRPRLETLRRYTLMIFHLANQKLDHISIPLRGSMTEPEILLGGTWICVPSTAPQFDDIYAEGTGNLILLTAPSDAAIELATNCQTAMQADTQTTLLAKQKIVGQSEGKWILVSADPPYVTPLPLSPKLGLLQWSDDGRSVFFFDRTNMTHGIMDTATWQPTVLPQPAYIMRHFFSPDSTRLVVLSDDLRNMWLYDTQGDAQGNLLAALPLTKFAHFDFTLRWSPDNQQFLLTDLAYDGRAIVYDRDGRQLGEINRHEVSYGYPTFTDPNLGWTNCEPAPKPPRLNLPQ